MKCSKCGKEMKYNKETELTSKTDRGEIKFISPTWNCDKCGIELISEDDMEEWANSFDKAYKEAKK